MNWAFRTMIVPVALVLVARAVAAALSPAGVGMFESALVPVDGPADVEPTHYISTGMIDAEFAPLLADGAVLYSAAAAAGADVTLEQCQALVAQSDVSDEPPFDALARIGLQLRQPIEELEQA